MGAKVSLGNDRDLLTATSAADPVLIRLSNGHVHMILLADDAVYEHSSPIVLKRVRWVRVPHGLRSKIARKNRSGFTTELTLRRANGYITAKIPQVSFIRGLVDEAHFRLVNLSHEQYLLLRVLAPSRFATMALHRTGASEEASLSFKLGASTRRLLSIARRKILAVVAGVYPLARSF